MHFLMIKFLGMKRGTKKRKKESAHCCSEHSLADLIEMLQLLEMGWVVKRAVFHLQLNKRNEEAVQMVSNFPCIEQRIFQSKYFDTNLNIAIWFGFKLI